MNQSSFNNISTNKNKVIVIILTMLFFFSYSICAAQVTLFEDDFEDGNANGWELESSWQVEDDSGNYVLSGVEHSWASSGDIFWKNYSFKIDVKLLDENSAIHLNYRNNGCLRYFIGFTTWGVYLNKTYPCGTHPELMNIEEGNEINRWYSVEIIGNEGNIKVYVDDDLKIEYTDPEPLLSGQIALETLDDGSVYFDNVLVTTQTDQLSETSWESTGGPLRGLGYDVRIHPNDKNIMFVTDNFAGVLKSENAGQNWYQANEGIDVKSGLSGDAVNIFSLTIDPNNSDIVWAGTNGEGNQFGVFKSTDSGNTWQKKVDGISIGEDSLDLNLVFRGFTVLEGNSNIVYAQAEVGTSIDGREFNRVKGRVYKSIDGGESWDIIWSGNNLARYLIVDPTNSNTLYLSTGIFDREAFNSDCENGVPGGEGILKSTDGGNSWSQVNKGLTDLYVGALRMHPTAPQTLFAATGNNACSGGYDDNLVSNLFKTVDGGLSWVKVLEENDLMTTINFSPSNPNIIYAGSSTSFYKSEDEGNTWIKLNNENWTWGPEGVVAGVPIDVVIDPIDSNTLYANNYGGGVFRSKNGAETWDIWSNGYSGAELCHLHIPIDSVYSLYVIGRSGPFFSNNAGSSWTGISNGDANYAEWYSISSHPYNSQIVLVSDEHQGVILQSVDGGTTFDERIRHPETDASDPNNRQGFKSIVFSKSNPNIVYAGISKESGSFETTFPVGTVIYKSIDIGETFSSVPSILDGHNINELAVEEKNEEIIYAATTNGVYKSIDGASSWQHCSRLGNRHIESLALDPDQSGYIVAGEGYLGSGIWISQDNGMTWSGPHNTGFNSANPYISAVINDPKNSRTFFASDLYSGVYCSEDNGLTWAAFPDWQMSGLTFRSVQDIAMNEKVLYAATDGGGVFKYTLDSTDNMDELPVINSFTISSQTANISESISFFCDAFDPDGGAVSYYFDFGDGSFEVDSNSSVHHSYDSEGTYFADCSVKDDEDNTQTSSSIEINVISNIPIDQPIPSMVSQNSPSSTIQTSSPTFIWSDDPASNWYKLWVGYNEGQKIYAKWYEADNICLNGECLAASDLILSEGNYKWYVKSWNYHGSAWSAGMTFTIQNNETPPSKVTLTSPSGQLTASTSEFFWVADPASTWYKLWIGHSDDEKIFTRWYDANEICANGNCSATTGTEFDAGNYIWYVKSWNLYDKTWSDGMHFSLVDNTSTKVGNPVLDRIPDSGDPENSQIRSTKGSSGVRPIPSKFLQPLPNSNITIKHDFYME